MKKYIISTFVLLFLFVSLLLFSFLLNDKKIKQNVNNSLINYNYYDDVVSNLKIDNYTDMIMLNVITYNNENSVIKRAFGNEFGFLYNDDNSNIMYWNQYENLKASLNNENDSSQFYGRFWHGYQIILKPFLRFFTYQQTLTIFLIIGSILLFYSGFLVLKKLNWKFLVAYILSLLSLNIYMFNTCYQYFFTMILMIIFNIIILYKYNKINPSLYFYIFGALTSYFLYISFPLITLCYPLILYLCLKINDCKSNYNYKESAYEIFKLSVFWLIGYVLFFAFKWILGTIFVGTNFIENALLSVTQRLGVTFSFDYIDILKLNFSSFFSKKINIVFTIVGIILLIINLKSNLINKIKFIFPFIIIFFMPFVWMFVCNNHSAIHYWYISRLFSISIFSIFVMVILLFNKKRNYNGLEKINKSDVFVIFSLISFILFYKFKLVFILINLLIVIVFKFDKNNKLFIILLILLNVFMLAVKGLSVNKFNDKQFFKDTYDELYIKAKKYGEQYINNHNISDNTKINIKDLITDINSDTVFLLECDGYIIYDGENVKPYINCDDVVVTDGYEN